MKNFEFDLSEQLAAWKQNIIVNECQPEGEISIINMQHAVDNCVLVVGKDGVETLMYKSKPVMRFHPIETEYDSDDDNNLMCRVVQKVEKIYEK